MAVTSHSAWSLQPSAARQSVKDIATAVVGTSEDTDDAVNVDHKAVLDWSTCYKFLLFWRTSKNEALASDIRQVGSYLVYCNL